MLYIWKPSVQAVGTPYVFAWFKPVVSSRSTSYTNTEMIDEALCTSEKPFYNICLLCMCLLHYKHMQDTHT